MLVRKREQTQNVISKGSIRSYLNQNSVKCIRTIRQLSVYHSVAPQFSNTGYRIWYVMTHSCLTFNGCGLNHRLSYPADTQRKNNVIMTLLFRWGHVDKPLHLIMSCIDVITNLWHGPLARYVKLRVAHAPGMPGAFSPPAQVSDPTCITSHASRTCRDACRDRLLAVAIEVGGGENVPSACATCNFMYLTRGP